MMGGASAKLLAIDSPQPQREHQTAPEHWKPAMRAIGIQIADCAGAWATPARVAVIVLSAAIWTSPAAQAEKRVLTYDDIWYYDGEVKFDPNLGTCARA